MVINSFVFIHLWIFYCGSNQVNVSILYIKFPYNRVYLIKPFEKAEYQDAISDVKVRMQL